MQKALITYKRKIFLKSLTDRLPHPVYYSTHAPQDVVVLHLYVLTSMPLLKITAASLKFIHASNEQHYHMM